MEAAHRDADGTPAAVQRTVRDEQGRTWVGTVSSGRQHESEAEVLFVCNDQPSEEKRVSSLGVDSAKADRTWSNMDDSEVRQVFERADRA